MHYNSALLELVDIVTKPYNYLRTLDMHICVCKLCIVCYESGIV